MVLVVVVIIFSIRICWLHLFGCSNPFTLPTTGCWGHPCSCRKEQVNLGAVAMCLILTPGNFTGVKGGRKHHEAAKPRDGVDYLSGLVISDLGLVWSRWGLACCRVCGRVMVGDGGLNPPHPRAAASLPQTASASCPAHSYPWVWADACLPACAHPRLMKADWC